MIEDKIIVLSFFVDERQNSDDLLFATRSTIEEASLDF